jgi:hypothetical protein
MVKAGKIDNLVEKAIAHVGGSPAELGRRLSEIAEEEVTRQRVHGWRMRGIFPRHMLPHVETLCKIPLDELIRAKPKDRDAGSAVERAIRLLGADATPAMLAASLSELSGKRVTRQMVNGWQVLEQFPIEMVPFVHMLTRIPVKELVEGRRGALKNRHARRQEKRA